MKKWIQPLFLLFLLLQSQVFGYKFQFDHKKGDIFRFVASSVQTAYIDNQKRAVYEQGYKAVLRVIEAGKDYGRIKGRYYYMAKPYGVKGAAYQVSEDRIYDSDFIRKSDGTIQISSNYFYPVVRNLPAFPDRDIKIGESWKGTGYESQDFRKIGIPQPFISPFNVRYKYVKDETVEGKDCAVIEVFYYINKHFKRGSRIGAYSRRGTPVRAMGFFKGKILWDKKVNEMFRYEGNYNFLYIMSNGMVREWVGNDNGEVTVVKVNREAEKKLKEETQKEVGKLAEVKEAKEGLKLIFSDILFDFNKVNLKPQVVPTLDKIVAILQKYSKYEVRVEGHSDDVGRPQYKAAIALGRARAVAKYLIKKGINPKRVSFQGFSDRKPLVPNNSEKNRAKNRRVEIYIITK